MLTAMGDVMRECYKRGWITTRDGNCSLRKSLDGTISPHMYITPRGVRKNTIHPEDIIKILDISSQDIYELPEGVSTEFFMHFFLQEDAGTTRSILHVHPTHVVAAMYAGLDLQEISEDFPEIKRYTRVGPSVDFFEAGSSSLAVQTNLQMRGSNPAGPICFDIVGQKNHGVCAVGKNPWDAFEHIERLNHVCEIALFKFKNS